MRVLEPTVRGDDESILRDRLHHLRIGSLPAGDDHHHSIRHASFLRWYYPDQVLRVGGAPAALSARFARAPHTLLEWYLGCVPRSSGRFPHRSGSRAPEPAERSGRKKKKPLWGSGVCGRRVSGVCVAG